MNKQTHQLVFNAARGCIMVVSEAAQRQGKRPGCVAGHRVVRSVALAWALTGLGAALVQAQIIADPTAPGNQRPTVLGTPNGAPLVNIQTPSAAGVSRNTYQQFDVGAPGVVLNNSRTNVQSQLGGWVQGNPWLATGEARIILNEVNSQNPSYLNGFIEVAGRRAEVIIANPAGIQVNGGGFINASRATLTTGTPVMNGGNLEAYRVQRGTIRIDGKGLDASLTDYTGVLSRAIEVNAQIHAQQLDMVTGINQVQAATGEVQSSTTGSTSGPSPSFALDVSELGGMYAGHIRLVGTEAGVGVRHHGTMAASVGDVQVDANGWLSSAGRIEARQGHVRIQTTGAQDHSGVLLAAENLTLNSGTSAHRQALTHSGQSRAGLEAHIRASDMRNTGQLDAQRLDVEVTTLSNRGEIWQTGAQALDVQAGQLINEVGAALGQVMAANRTNPHSPDTTTPGTPTAPSEPEAESGATPTNPSQPAQPNQPAPTQLAAGQVKLADLLLQQDGAVLASEGDMHLSSLQTLRNAGDVRVHTLQVQGERIENTAGTVWARNVSIDTQAFEQAQGAELYGQSSLNLQTDTLSNSGLIQSGVDAQLEIAQALNNSGTLAAATDVVLQANDFNNTDGQVVAGRDLQVQASNTLNNTRGVLSAQRQLAVRDAASTLQPQEVQARQLQVVNTQGRIVANSTTDASSTQVDIQAKSLNLGDGTLHSGGDMVLDLVGSLRTLSGQNVRAGGNLSVQLHGVGDSTFSNAGQWQVGQNLTIRADHIDNQAGGELSSQATTSLSTLQNASGSVTNRGLVDGVDTRVQTHTLTNTGTGRVFGDRVAMAAYTLTNREETVSGVTKAGTIAARERLDIGARHIINREGALLFSAGNMAVGVALDSDFRAKTDGSDNAKTFNNNSATVESLGDMALATDVLRNTNEHFETQLAVIAGPEGMTLIQPSGSSTKQDSSLFRWEGWSRAGQYRYVTQPSGDAETLLGQTPVPRVEEQSCTGTEDAEVCTRLPGSDYLPTDPAWAYFQVQAPASEPPKPTLIEPVSPDSSSASTCESGLGHDAQACTAFSDALTQYQADQDAYESAWTRYEQELAIWQAQTDERYEALDAAIERYNNGFAGAVIRSWTQYNIMRTISESQVTSSVPGQILSGQSMSLKGSEMVNDKSRIVAGGQLTGDLDRLSNVQSLGQHVVHEQGTAQDTWSRWRGGFKRYHQRDWSGVSDYAPPDVVTTITLSVAETLQNTRPVGSATAVAGRQSVGGLSKASTVNNPNNPGSALTEISASALVVPNSSLFKVDPQSNARYLVETDPRFANYRQWLSSDYLLTASGFKPEVNPKRLGDGFYEQKLIREQVAALTGYRFLGDYSNDEAQYTALMNAGATFAQAHQLRPGIALSGAQVAQLTSDIVWLVTRDVQLPDGSTTTALVPQVYLSPRSGDLAANGALFGGPQNAGSQISARSIELALSGDLNNSGTMAGRQLLDISAKNIENTGLLQGGMALMQAEQDIDVIGGQVLVHRGLSVQAGEDFTLASTTQGGSAQAGANRFSQQGVDRVAGLYVSGPAGVLLANAGRDMNLVAAQVRNQGAGVTQFKADGGINLGTVKTEQSQNINWSDVNYLRQSSSTEVGTQISGGGAVNLVAQDDVRMRAAQVEAAGRSSIKSETGNVVIDAGERQESLDTSRQTIRRGTLSKTTTTTRTQMSSAQAQRSTISGQGVEVLGENVVSVGTVFDSQSGELYVKGRDKTLLYEARDMRSATTQVDSRRKGTGLGRALGVGFALDKKSSETTKKASDVAVVTQLKSDQAVRIGVGELAELQGAKVIAPQIVFERATGADPQTAGVLRLGAAIEQNSSSVERKVESAKLWQKQEGSGRTEQTAVMTQLDGEVTFAQGLQIGVDVPQTQGQPMTGANLQEQIEQLAGQSGLGYLQQLQTNPAVKFNEVKLAVDSWSYKQQGLTEAGAALVAIAVAVATGGAGAGLVGTTTATATGTVTTLGGMTLATTTAATATAASTAITFAAGAAVNAGFAALASQAAVSFANNGGDLGQTLKDMGDKDAVKNVLIAMGAAGLGASVAGQGVGAVAAQTLTGCVAGEVSGAGCESGAKTAAVHSGAGEAYRAWVGYAANAGPGENRNGTKLDGTSTGDGSYEFTNHASLNFGQQQPADRGMNVIGLNKPGSLLTQGSTVSRALNQVPFINATAGIHDYIFNANPDLNFTLWNVPTMLPSAALSIPAALNNPNISWITQIKQPESIKTPVVPSLIRVDANLTTQITPSTGSEK